MIERTEFAVGLGQVERRGIRLQGGVDQLAGLIERLPDVLRLPPQLRGGHHLQGPGPALGQVDEGLRGVSGGRAQQQAQDEAVSQAAHGLSPPRTGGWSGWYRPAPPGPSVTHPSAR
jgi:hypothetical protein